MAIKLTSMTRVFVSGGAKLPNPNPNMTFEEVRTFYAAQYPELATAVVNGRRGCWRTAALHVRTCDRLEGVR